MPIYAYRCTSCGFEKDHLQKLDELPLRVCPQCGQATYDKQVTAAGFQLKGSGWYVTDFKNSKSKPADNAAATKDSTQTKTAPATDSTANKESNTASTAAVE